MNARMKQLEDRITAYREGQRFTVFLLENGSTFSTMEGPVDYLVRHGTATPQGRIVGYPHPTEGVDPLSLSLYEMIDGGIKKGGFQDLLDGLESDEL